jgi:4-carboxymuconolactone decarboxylase
MFDICYDSSSGKVLEQRPCFNDCNLSVRGESMANEKALPSTRERLGDVAPKLVDLTEKVLFGDVWERPGLSKRDRSVITVTALVAMNRTEQLPFHLQRALDNGVTKDEIVEMITHLAFYSGWPTAMSAMRLAKEAFEGNAKQK